VNKFLATGNLTRDPEMRYTPSGKAVTEFSIAVNEGSGERRTTEYIDCQCWDKLAELVAEHCRRGRKVLIEGRLTTEKWTDAKTNQERRRTRIKCNSVEFLDAPRGTNTTPGPVEDDLAGLKF
jgi:single-strand DNA-binding protein